MESFINTFTWAYNTTTYIYNIPQNFKHSSASWLIDSYPDYGAYATVIYLWIVFRLTTIMQTRPAFSLHSITFIWNLLLSIFSLLGASVLIPAVISSWQQRGFYSLCCEMYPPIYKGNYIFWLSLFGYSKTPELMDTLFLILQKKKVSFLHWYHHLVTALFCWHVAYAGAPPDVLFATMNYAVHAIMYLYYALVSLGLRQYIRPIAPVITTLQILQMFAGSYIVLFAAYYRYIYHNNNNNNNNNICDYDDANLRMGLMMYGSYCVLFCVLFKELYWDRPIMAENNNNNNNNGILKKK